MQEFRTYPPSGCPDGCSLGVTVNREGGDSKSVSGALRGSNGYWSCRWRQSCPPIPLPSRGLDLAADLFLASSDKAQEAVAVQFEQRAILLDATCDPVQFHEEG